MLKKRTILIILIRSPLWYIFVYLVKIEGYVDLSESVSIHETALLSSGNLVDTIGRISVDSQEEEG